MPEKTNLTLYVFGDNLLKCLDLKVGVYGSKNFWR